MNEDAPFETGIAQSLRLRAATPGDLVVISALVQDAVCHRSQIAWLRKRRRFSLLLNRFRWEDEPNARQLGRVYERVQSLLSVESALDVRANGVDPRVPRFVLSLLALDFDATEDGAGQVCIFLAGGGAIAIDVECLDVTLADVTRPYAARSPSAPNHHDD